MIVNLLQFIAVLASMIMLHELGHFAACRLFGVEVEEFGFGFPPRITKLFTLRGTEYTLNWIPLGGFVKPRGESQPEVEGGLAASSPLVRIGVYIAGPLMNLLAAVIIYAVIISQLGIPDGSVVQIGDIVSNSPASEAGLMVGDTILSINGVDSDSYDALRGEIGGHHHTVHHIGIQLHDLSQGLEILFQHSFSAAIQAPFSVRYPDFLERTGISYPVALAGASLLMLLADQDNEIHQSPVLRGRDGSRIGRIVIGSGLPFYKPARY